MSGDDPTPASDLDQAESDARLHSWRVYGLDRVWTDRPPGAVHRVTETPPGVDVYIGDIPRHVVEAVRTTSGPRGEDGQVVEEQADAAEKSLRAGYSSWLTIDVSDGIRVVAARDATTKWAPYVGTRLSDHGKEAEATLDRMFLGNVDMIASLRVTGLLSERRSWYLLAEGRDAIVPPRLSWTSRTRHEGPGWAEIVTPSTTGSTDGTAEMKSEPAGSQAELRRLLSDLGGSAGQWLSEALREPDTAERRFTFAFNGLEALANRISKHFKTTVIEALTAEMSLPLDVLAWPPDNEKDRPRRSLAFSFAVTAIWLDRSTASVNVDTFKLLHKTRNDIAHGQPVSDSEIRQRASQAFHLLMNCLVLLGLRVRAGGCETLPAMVPGQDPQMSTSPIGPMPYDAGPIVY